MAFIDYYKILGVDKNIPQKDVRAAYLKRTKMFHPDLHPDDPKAKAKFQALNEAYDVISDPEKRKKYDAYGEHWREADAFGASSGGRTCGGSSWGGAAGGGSMFDGFDFGGGSGGFSSFFQDLFGSRGGMGGGRRGGSMHGSSGDATATVDIDMYTALLGGEVIIQLGNGSKIKLKVKEGTQNGSKVRLPGKGYGSGGGRAGDLIITYNVVLPTNLSEQQKALLRQMRGM